MSFDVRMRGFKKLTPLNNALMIIRNNLPFDSIGNESVDIYDAVNRYLSNDVLAPIDVPPFDRSAVDGYAVKSEDTLSASKKNPVILKVIGEVLAGSVFQKELQSLETVYITTGAPIPKGADAVVMIENTNRVGDKVEIYSPIPKYGNVSLQGEDIKKGSIIFEKGHRIRFVDVGVLASLNICKINVKKIPIVAIFTSGEELIEPCHEFEEGKIIETHILMYSNYLKKLGFEPLSLGIVPDDEEQIKKTLKIALQKADAVITTGGSSVGKSDLITPTINSLGKPGILFHGITIQPGKPTLFAVINGKPIFGLPGFPVSSFFAFSILVKPALLYMLGVKAPKQYFVYAKLSRRVSSKLGITTLVRVRLKEENGELIAEPIRAGGSTILTSISHADGYFEIPENMEGLEKGAKVKVILFDF